MPRPSFVRTRFTRLQQLTVPGRVEVSAAVLPAYHVGTGALPEHDVVQNGRALDLVTTNWFPMEPFSEYGNDAAVRRWAKKTSATIHPVRLRIAARQFLMDTTRVLAAISSASALSGTVLVIRTVSNLRPGGTDEDAVSSRMVPASKEIVERIVMFKVLTEGGPSSTSSSGFMSTGEDCSICQSAMAAGEEIGTMPCNHAFHAACIRRWLERCSGDCPLCRYRLPSTPPSLLQNEEEHSSQ